MVKALHRAGIEVILDVVYNHTAEGNELGPMLSFKGVDNLSAHGLSPATRVTTTSRHGQFLNPVHPRAAADHGFAPVLRARKCHVDGFRFDLASALAREFYDVDRLSPFFDVIHQDPVLAGEVDRRAVGRRRGRLPGWQLPDPVDGVERALPRHDAGLLARPGAGAFAQRFTGSSDLYQSDGRRPFASINFVTAHDGFTCATSSRTSGSATRPTSRTTATARTTTVPGTAAWKGRPTIPR